MTDCIVRTRHATAPSLSLVRGGPGSEIFSDHLPRTESFVIKHHHLGYLVQDRAQWDAVHANGARKNLPIAAHSSNPLVDVCFVEVPEPGHYL